ncbi:MAG: MBOAT family protein [Planctomycetota bacterium]
MLFTSAVFLYAFLPLVLGLYYLAPSRHRALVLTLASYVFYGWWRPDFVALMWVSTAVDFTAGRGIGRDRERGGTGKRWVLLSCAVNLGLLAYFKYANFGVDTLNQMLRAADLGTVKWAEVVLPVGISFYTFQTLSYTVDVFRGQAAPVRRFVDFACYVSMFPQLVAGPIVRYRSIAEQLAERTHTAAKFTLGMTMFQAGLAKKVLLADTLAPLATAGFAAETLSTGEAWTAALAYTFQLYFDFSGYSDMALGLGLMFGFRLPVNFDRPYVSRSITEFWRRWHISLSSFLRDYLYVPLGGNRKGPVRTYVNLGLTMLLGGLWHGASWTFVVWGAYHGALLAIERMTGKRSLYAALPAALENAITFVLVVIGWVVFKAETLGDAGRVLGAMFAVSSGEAAGLLANWSPMLTLTASAAGLIVWLCPTTQRLAETRRAWWTWAMLALFALALLRLHRAANVPFLYFQF